MRSRSLIWILLSVILLLTLFSVVSLLFARELHIKLQSKLLAMTASTGFVMIALIGIYLNRSSYSILVLIGLFFCWLGDFWGSNRYIFSVIAFLIAHLFFTAGFWIRGIQIKKSLLFLTVFAPVSGIIYKWLYPYLPEEHIVLVLIYIITITVMVISSAAAFHGPGRTFILVGAILFYISDIFVARWKYVSPSHVNAFFCYPLYYIACVSLALSTVSTR